jgi:hypothetical protein
MKFAKVAMPSNNKILEGKVMENHKNLEKVEECKKARKYRRMDISRGHTVEIGPRQAPIYCFPSYTEFEKVKRKSWKILTGHGHVGGNTKCLQKAIGKQYKNKSEQ